MPEQSAAPRPGRLILVRHGESTFNADQRFTGLLDVPLTEYGVEQCEEAAHLLDESGIRPTLVVTTPLERAWRTAEVIVERLRLPEPKRDWRLAERDYGWLTNLPKHLVRKMFGEQEFFRWRRTMDGRPPAAPAPLVNSWGELAKAELGPLSPGMSESLADVVVRVRQAWDELAVEVMNGQDVLVVAHGNSLRALCAVVENLTDEQVQRLNLPSGSPLVYEFDGGRAVGHYLDPHTAHARAAAVAAEGGT